MQWGFYKIKWLKNDYIKTSGNFVRFENEILLLIILRVEYIRLLKSSDKASSSK